MSPRAGEVLELLLPEATEAFGARARSLMTFLRLVADDASPRRAASVRLALDGARAELERATSERLLAALRDLLAHHLTAAGDPESFLDLGVASQSHQEAWTVLEEERAEHGWLAQVPAPGERPLEVASRLLTCAERVGLCALEAELWRARLRRLAEGPRAGEEALRALLERPEAKRPSRLARTALANLVECLLDRAAVQAALALLEAQASGVASEPRLARLLSWARLVAGDEPGARSALSAAGPARQRVPAPLADLRVRRPEWLPLLAGPAARGRKRRRESATTRSDLGAALLAVFAVEGDGSARVVHLDCAPGLKSRLAAWTEGREGARRRAGELEQELSLRAEPCVSQREQGYAPRGAIAPESIRAVALSPMLDGEGDVTGWLRLECEHHLLPSDGRLRALALAWRERVLVPRRRAEDAARDESSTALFGPAPGAGACADELRALVERLAFKSAQRRWWGLVVRGGTPLLAVCDGGALEPWRERPGGGRGVRRALSCSAAVRFDEPDVALSIAAEAAAGIVVPLVHRGCVVALLAIESTRRRDFAGALPALERGIEGAAAALRVARFRDWHGERFGHDVWFDVAAPACATLVADLVVAAASPEPVTLSGPAGSGKQVLARWIHFESARAAGPLCVHACGARDPLAEERELFGADASGRPRASAEGLFARARTGTLVLDDIERLAPAVQARLERRLCERHLGDDDPRLVATTRAALRDASSEGHLRGDLGRRLERLELFVPALAERREEIGWLCTRLAARFSRELGQAAPAFSDEALALLWRQPWNGNLRELENVVYKLVLLGGSGALQVAQVEEVARRFRLELVRRTPSRQPDRALLASALRSTYTARGSLNKTRAALYLGWDPDTLCRRLEEAGLAEPNPTQPTQGQA